MNPIRVELNHWLHTLRRIRTSAIAPPSMIRFLKALFMFVSLFGYSNLSRSKDRPAQKVVPVVLGVLL